MNSLFRLQFLGPLALFSATLCAELAARALQYAPSSEFLWFVNLRMFGIFQRSYAMLSEFVAVDGFQFFGIALPIFALACFGLAAKSRLPLALAGRRLANPPPLRHPLEPLRSQPGQAFMSSRAF
jgi:hypothetical protein